MGNLIRLDAHREMPTGIHERHKLAEEAINDSEKVKLSSLSHSRNMYAAMGAFALLLSASFLVPTSHTPYNALKEGFKLASDPQYATALDQKAEKALPGFLYRRDFSGYGDGEPFDKPLARIKFAIAARDAANKYPAGTHEHQAQTSENYSRAYGHLGMVTLLQLLTTFALGFSVLGSIKTFGGMKATKEESAAARSSLPLAPRRQ